MRSRVGQAATVAMLFALWAVIKYFSLVRNVWELNEYSDTYYYFTSAQAALASGNPLATMTPEYPTPAAALLLAPYLAGGTDWDTYRWNFLVLVVGVDALFVLLLAWRAGAAGVIVWTLLESIAGSLALLRLDIVPAVLGAAALLLVLRGRDPVAGPVAAVGAGVKLWPALLLPLTLGSRRARIAAAVSGALTAAVLVGGSIAAAGFDRLLSPLAYQSGRGLQIESVAATPAMLARLGEPGYTVEYTQWHAYEIVGPGTDQLIEATRIASYGAVALLVLLYVAWFRGGARLEAAGYLALFAISAFMASSKALSPQYLLWLAAPVAALFGWSFLKEGRVITWPAGLSVLSVTMLLVFTHEIYPTHYDAILSGAAPGPMQVLAARNVLLVAFSLWCAAVALTASRGHSSGGRPFGG